MSLSKITSSPTVPELIDFYNLTAEEVNTKCAKLESPTFTGTPNVPTAPTGTSTKQAASTAFVQTEIANKVNEVVPIGTIIAFAANSAPTGYVLCNGANVSRTTYSNLFAVIGTTYGEGDGSTTFTLPNLIDRFIEGSSTAGNYYSAGLPNIQGYIWNIQIPMANPDLGFVGDGTLTGHYQPAGSLSGNANRGVLDSLEFKASYGHGIYRDGVDTVQPNSLTCRFYIKY